MSQAISGVIVGDGNIFTSPTTKLDEALSATSINAVQNKAITNELNKKQNTLTFDITPKNGSTNPVTSGGIKTAMDALSEKIVSPVITVTTLTGSTVTATKGTTTLKGAENGTTGKFTIEIPSLGEWTITASKTGSQAFTRSATVNVSEIKQYEIKVPHGTRYGYRIKKTESDPYGRVEYLYDAVGLTPAKMDFTKGTFNYGSWGDKWFITKNKPCMIRSNGTIDYYLNPNNYALKENGTPSDVANTSYDGNAMASIPLCWVYRYEDDTYQYEIISDVKYDDNYKAYAHTKADGSIADYFYWGIYGGSNGSATTKMRSLSGQTLSYGLTAEQEINSCKMNGSKWFTHTWSQKELLRTLLILMGKSTNTQAVFGIGNCSSGSVLKSGTLDTKGQFYGTNANSSSQVKAFHIEKIWGDQWDRLAGLIYNNGNIYVKMTPEGTNGYRVNDVSGYTNTGIQITGSSGGYINGSVCSEFGAIPNKVSGSDKTYEADLCWFSSGLNYALAGASVTDASGGGGVFSLAFNHAPSWTAWNYGSALSLI